MKLSIKEKIGYSIGDFAGSSLWQTRAFFFLLVLYTLVMVPYNTLVDVMTPDPVERTSLSSYKFVFAYAAGLMVQALLIAFASTKERVKPDPKIKTSLKNDLKNIILQPERPQIDRYKKRAE